MEEDKNIDGSGYFRTPESRSSSKRQVAKFRTESAIEEPLSPLMPQDTQDQIP